MCYLRNMTKTPFLDLVDTWTKQLKGKAAATASLDKAVSEYVQVRKIMQDAELRLDALVFQVWEGEGCNIHAASRRLSLDRTIVRKRVFREKARRGEQ